MTQKTTQNPWTLDVRVRERNLKSGALTDKDLEKYLAQLPDVGEAAEPFATPQPALAQPEMPVEMSAEDEADDEEIEETPVVQETAAEVPSDVGVGGGVDVGVGVGVGGGDIGDGGDGGGNTSGGDGGVIS